MKFNYAKLLGKIRESGFSQTTLADAIGVNKGTLSLKLKNRYSFTANEIIAICDALHIDYKDIPQYFFVV